MVPSFAPEALDLLQQIDAFQQLDRELLERVAGRACEVRADAGEYIVREGELGDVMYLLACGSAQLLARAFDGSDVVLARLEAGQYFGEQVLLQRPADRRGVSVRALSSCRLFAIARTDLLQSLDPDSPFIRELRAADDAQHELRRCRLREEVLRGLGVAPRHKIQRRAAGEVVFRQGDPGDRVYLVIAGTAQVTQHRDGAEVVLSELLPGQFFGELAILNDQPRSATVRAVTDLELASLEAAWFREVHANNPQLRSIMRSIESMYMLPKRGLLTLQAGMLGSRPTLTAIQDLPDGRRVVSTRLVDHAAFTARQVGAAEATDSVRFEDPQRHLLRELHLADGRIVELECVGEWEQLGELHALMLDGTPIAAADLAGFEVSGVLGAAALPPPEAPDVICRCARVSARQIVDAIASGAQTVEQVARATRATLVCGGCAPQVRELLGQSGWTPARCECVIPVTEDVRTFRIRPLHGNCTPWLPGQHLVVQARIDDNWVQRPYTLSSPHGHAGAYEITVKRESEGVFSRWLFDRLRGDSMLRVSQPAGKFVLPPDQTRDVLCLVAGIGVTPALAMARAVRAMRPSFRFHLDYSASSEQELVCREELLELAQAEPRISVKLRVTRRDGRLGGLQMQSLLRTFPDADCYLCGSAGYMNSLRRHLDEAGVPPERVHLETFTIAGEHPVVKALARTEALHDAHCLAPADRLPILRTLAALACADGRLADEERALLDTLVDRYRLSEAERREFYDFVQSHPTLDTAGVEQLSPDGQRRVLELASLLAHIDGVLHSDESANLRQLRRRCTSAADADDLVAIGRSRARRGRELL